MQQANDTHVISNRSPALLSFSEAAALLEPKHGKRVHFRTIRRWVDCGHFRAVNCNGWKVVRSDFLEWARRAGKLKLGLSNRGAVKLVMTRRFNRDRQKTIQAALARIQRQVGGNY